METEITTQNPRSANVDGDELGIVDGKNHLLNQFQAKWHKVKRTLSNKSTSMFGLKSNRSQSLGNETIVKCLSNDFQSEPFTVDVDSDRCENFVATEIEILKREEKQLQEKLYEVSEFIVKMEKMRTDIKQREGDKTQQLLRELSEFCEQTGSSMEKLRRSIQQDKEELFHISNLIRFLEKELKESIERHNILDTNLSIRENELRQLGKKFQKGTSSRKAQINLQNYSLNQQLEQIQAIIDCYRNRAKQLTPALEDRIAVRRRLEIPIQRPSTSAEQGEISLEDEIEIENGTENGIEVEQENEIDIDETNNLTAIE